jgi:hypothetical protein
VRIGIVVGAAVLVLTVAELTSERFNEFTRDHSLISTFITEAVLLLGVYLVIDEIFRRRETRRWSDVTSFGMRALSEFARRPAEIVRRVVEELGEGEASPDGLPDRLAIGSAPTRRVPARSRTSCGRAPPGSRRRSSAGARRSWRIPTPPSCSTCCRTSSTPRARPPTRSLRLPVGSTAFAGQRRTGSPGSWRRRSGSGSRTA